MAMSPRSKATITFTIFFLLSVFSSNLTMDMMFDNTAKSVQSKDIMKLENMLYKNYFTSKKRLVLVPIAFFYKQQTRSIVKECCSLNFENFPGFYR